MYTVNMLNYDGISSIKYIIKFAKILAFEPKITDLERLTSKHYKFH
jgi:hypothetical protein